MKKRRRPQLKLKKLLEFLHKLPPDCKLMCGPSMLNIDEPPARQEFIDENRALKLVCVEYLASRKEITFGYVEEFEE